MKTKTFGEYLRARIRSNVTETAFSIKHFVWWIGVIGICSLIVGSVIFILITIGIFIHETGMTLLNFTNDQMEMFMSLNFIFNFGWFFLWGCTLEDYKLWKKGERK